MAVANAPVLVTTDMNIKVPVNLMIHFLCRKLKEMIVSENFFQI